MDSRLENIFRTTFRHTEATDTWQGIRRDENRDDGGKKNDKEKERKETPVWEDRTIVSVQALKIFLENLIGDTGENPAKTTGDAAATGGTIPSPSSKGTAAHAVRAYQQTAHTAQDLRSGAPGPQDAKVGSGTALSPAEIRTIHKLIDDLGTLAGRGIAQLEIRRSDSFLQSLIDAAAAASQSL